MTPFVESFTTILSIGIVLSNIATIIFIVSIFLRNNLFKVVSRHALTFSTIIALGAAFGSLFYSSVAGFVPCELCWWQRLFLFPQAVIFAIAWYRRWMYKIKSDEIFLYSLGLSIIGILIGLFHYYGTMFNPDILAACEVGGVSCAKQYFLMFGFINIPYMSLSAFALLGSIALIKTLDK
ncbi:disulfide bond formation protein B [Candidatus Parcubacteria bacterium]|nr:disulfide bond formation protein B [Candidatus Parcubacteria bacterium]